MKKVTIIVLFLMGTTFLSDKVAAQCSQFSNLATCVSYGGTYNSYFYITANVPLSVSSEIRTGEDGGWGGTEVNWVYTAWFIHTYSGSMFQYQTDYKYTTVPASDNDGQIEIWADAGTGDYVAVAQLTPVDKVK